MPENKAIPRDAMGHPLRKGQKVYFLALEGPCYIVKEGTFVKADEYGEQRLFIRHQTMFEGDGQTTVSDRQVKHVFIKPKQALVYVAGECRRIAAAWAQRADELLEEASKIK